jgi:hypothetical protein
MGGSFFVDTELQAITRTDDYRSPGVSDPEQIDLALIGEGT